MSFIQELENDVTALLGKIKSSAAVKTVETDVQAIGKSALSYIENNGLKDLYQIALAALTGAATGTPFAAIGATVLKQGEAAGISIAKGAEGIVLAQAQADLVAAGSLASPTSGTTVAAAPVTDPAA